MKLYVANCTTQHRIFQYRLPETKKGGTQTIRAGAQKQIGGDLNQFDVNAVVEARRRYGLIQVTELGSARGPITEMFSIDKVITAQQIRAAIKHNHDVKVIRGHETRRDLAIVAHKTIAAELAEQPGIGRIGDLETELVEQRAGEAPGAEEPLREAFRVTERPGDKPSEPKAPRAAKGRRRAA